MSDFSVTNLILNLASQNNWKIKHLDFQDTFPSEKLEREVYVELPKYMYSEEYRKWQVMRLKRPLYGLRHAV